MELPLLLAPHRWQFKMWEVFLPHCTIENIVCRLSSYVSRYCKPEQAGPKVTIKS